jgi:hypothetical protein
VDDHNSMTSTAQTQQLASPINPSEAQSLKTDITRLQSETSGLRDRQDWWSRWGLCLGWAAAGIAVASYAFQNQSSRIEMQARPIYDNLSRKQERLRLLEDQDSEYRIEQAQKVAEEARATAGEIERDNIKLRGALDKEVEDAKSRAEQLRTQNDVTETRLVPAREQIESERLKRVKLAASPLPRHVFDQSGLINLLSSENPRLVRFVYLDESEPRNLAEQLAAVFSALHWRFLGLRSAVLEPSRSCFSGQPQRFTESKTFSAHLTVLKPVPSLVISPVLNVYAGLAKPHQKIAIPTEHPQVNAPHPVLEYRL